MDEPLTIRIADRSRLSIDSGESRWLRDDEALRIRDSLSVDGIPRSYELGAPTACTLATIGEGRHARPIDGTSATESPAAQSDLGGGVQISQITRSDSRTLREVLDLRHSAHDCGDLGLDELATVIVRSGRTRDWADRPNGSQVLHRPVPSAGGRHPCSLLVAAHGVAGLRNGWWSFDAAACSLTTEEIPTPTDDFLGQQQVLAALQQPPVAAIVIVASFVRTLLRYPAGTVHVWRDAGALLATLHLCATDIGLRSCITGGVGLLRADRWDEMTTDVGAVVLGR